MPVDYEKICEENLDRYGWDIERVAQMAFADSYADRTHFIFELLQNAEDAIGRRGDSWAGDRTVSFSLSQDLLRVGHYGAPFNENDVRGICGIGESTKSGDYTTIGRFGIGFKSVYAFTEHPEVHSGSEEFAIESFVWPKPTAPIDRDNQETVFLIPLGRDSRVDDNDKIADALAELDVRSFLFLRQIEELRWEVEGCDSGHYLREVKILDEIARRVNVIGHVEDLVGDETDVNEEWIVFSRRVLHGDKDAGHVELAFYVDRDTGEISELTESKLVVHFPTVLETRLGFLVQGPYRTTPNRDNVPPDDKWNQHLVNETCVLLRDALSWLRDRQLLDATVLRCLPLESFPGNMLAPLFSETRQLLSTEPLLPKFGGGYITADRALMGDSEAIRRLLSDEQLSELWGRPKSWLSGDFTVDRNPELRRYLMSELEFSETTAESILREMRPEFLESQSDDWMIRLYEFLGTQRALRSQLQRLPLIRLDDDTHIAAGNDSQPKVYLPTENRTDFPTVKKALCISPGALNFLESLGIKEPDLVDDVIANLMPKYEDADSVIGIEEYESDISRISNAFRSADSYSQRQRLLDVLTSNSWVMTSDSGHGTKRHSKPSDVYLATHRLTILFSKVSGVRLVDEEYECLKSDTVRSILIECGAASNFRPIQFENEARFSDAERQDMRIRSHSDERLSYEMGVYDRKLEALEDILSGISGLEFDSKSQISSFLWEALNELDRKYFEGEYKWSYYSVRSCSFDASFVDLLNRSVWIATEDGKLKRPNEVEFNELGWHPNEFLQTKIKFKSSDIENVAKKHGVDPGLLDQIVKRFASGELTEHDWNTAFPATTVAYVENETGTHVESNASERPGSNSYAQSLSDAMTPSPIDASDSPVVMPSGGPKTAESAKHDTQSSLSHGRQGRRVTREVTRFAPSAASRGLDEKFKNMLSGDYGRRCQICGRTFRTRKGDLQAFADHVVAPSESTGTNHFGNLMSLCGWHYALISYGQWVLLDPVTEEPIDAAHSDPDAGGIVKLLEKAETEFDNDGYQFITLPIRFWNIYSNWRSDAEHIDGEIRFTLPHRTYLVELLKT
ncbi:MAG: hypothetical protein F4Y63_00900 [Chloroflexi bacterium]|nr:hypothetical protein [Chloroflexota bacterium]MYK61099.1 hypothetical protein [Chloroflexota bacterium]